MSVRERLSDISELNNTELLMQMTDAEFNNYIRDLNSFVDQLSDQEAEIKNALEEKDYHAFTRWLVDVRDALINLYADGVAEECLDLINGLAAGKYDIAEAMMIDLSSRMSLLSVDIQMAVYTGEEDGGAEVAAENTELSECGKKSILAVDDNAFSLDMLKLFLRGCGFRFIGLDSGAAALKFLQNHSPNLFILDVEMPDMDGYELAHEIRACGKKAPILFLTGNTTKEYVSRAIRAGAAGFIIKPVTQKLVLERIRKFI